MPKGTSVNSWRPSPALIAVFLLALAVGSYLRLHMLSSQILLDDEWHGIIQVTGRTLAQVATNLDPTDNATVPFGLYYWSLYRWFHWSEWTLRLPSIVAGLASLVLLPWWIRRILGDRVAAVFALLLAIAPVLVFYSRFARAYGLSALLCFGVLVLAHEWLTTARRRYAVGAVLLGTLAVYVHQTSIVAVFAPWLIALGLRLAGRTKAIVVPTQALLYVGAVNVLLCLPVLRSMLPGGSMVRWGKGTATLDGAGTALSMISGTAHVPLVLGFFGFCIAGYGLLWKEKPLLSRILVGATGLSAAFLLVSHPDGIDSGPVFLRYMIVVVPIALLGVAIAIERVTRLLAVRLRMDAALACALGAVLVAAGLLFGGPLPQLQRSPNDFTSHSAFQGSYRPPSWDRSDARAVYPSVSRRVDQVSPFYRWLAGQTDVAAIVEYPFDVCNFNNLGYFDQHVHGKRVLGGYCSDPRRVGTATLLRPQTISGSIPRMLVADAILSRVPVDERVAFRNMADVAREDALRASGADIVVVHKAFPIVVMNDDHVAEFIPVHLTSTDDLGAQFRSTLGPPVYEDAELVCFRVTR